MSDSAKTSTTPKKTTTSQEDEHILEKKRLRILEQRLSQKLRQSNARRQEGRDPKSVLNRQGGKSGSPGKSSLVHAEERPSSDGELVVKRNTSPRGLTPPVELLGSRDIADVDRGVNLPFVREILNDKDKLEKVKQLQVRIILIIILSS